ncbi:MAG: amidohydrolase family protein [Solirubrobacteraceae bacterium]
MLIDAYAHVFPWPLIEALSEVSDGAELAALRSQSPHLYDDERRVRFMDEHGIDVQVLVLARPPVWLGMERSVLHRLTRVANDSIAQFAARRPDRFVGIGVLPVVDEVMMQEFDRLHGELGLKGVLIFTNIEGRPLDDTSMWPLYDRAAELDVPIWIHPQHAGYYPWIGDNVLDRTLGWPFDTSLAMARLVYGGVFEKHPAIKFVTHHMGGMIPYFAARIDAFERSTAAEYARLGLGGTRGPALSAPGLDHFRRFHNDCISNGSSEALAMAIDFFGVDHILFGTDFPFGPPDGSWVRDELRAVADVDLAPSHREQIRHGNAERLLRRA